MGKKTKITGYHVRVRPDAVPMLVGKTTVECKRIACQDLVKEIRRHVDNQYAVTIVEDGRVETCEHCGALWSTVDRGREPPHNGGCCEQDAEVYTQHEEETS